MSSLADRARVADLDAQILLPVLERSDESPSELRSVNGKQLVQERLDSYRYPVLTLPTEITVEIFIHFLPIYPACPPLLGPYSPTLLTQICRAWREIALETPALWRAIWMSPSMPFERQPPLFDMWLSRSLCYPLSLDFSENDINRLHTTKVLSAAIVHCARWEHLNLELSTSLLRTIEGPMPLLRSLNLQLVDQDLVATQVASRETPLLRTVVLNHFSAGTLALPWSQLTSLTLRWVYLQECVPILQQTSNLVHCRLEFDDNHFDTVHNITLPALESLTLTGGSAIRYLETFTVPALRDLQVPELLLEPNPIEILAAFISRSCSKLQNLHITQRYMATLAADRARVVDTEAQILLLGNSPVELQSEKQLAQARLDSYTYPVLTLPNEIVGEILRNLCPLAKHSPGNSGSVASDIIIPSLQSHLYLKLCDMWLSRSRCYPFFLSLDELAFNSSQAIDALSALVPHRARWQHLCLHSLSPSRLNTIHGLMPLLRTLDLSLAKTADPFAPQVSIREVPLLRTARLTSLTLRCFYPRESVSVLQNTLNLVHCGLGLVVDNHDDEEIPDIPLPALRSLTLRGRSIPGYLETLIVPALRNLRLSDSFLPFGSIDTALASSRIVSQNPYRKAFPLAKISVDN
ncbi:hypothetical protein DFH08DRAFT_1075667 [Mycena albidolilacea]|uniref:F-box domain-containing protein n=1 Tax=Mycena albidolilacea TaxID=1033008 RepID=A0AAD7EY26_9AGAR|nr:hypothetical protein DFH08DRAFT_1075667 [Mycena albidolilacea]